jgi:hypothetical protein
MNKFNLFYYKPSTSAVGHVFSTDFIGLNGGGYRFPHVPGLIGGIGSEELHLFLAGLPQIVGGLNELTSEEHQSQGKNGQKPVRLSVSAP